MNLDSVIKRGRLPWRPRPEAGELEVWHEYEIPLTGVFRLHGHHVMFTQVMESAKGLSAWAYACLSESEAEELSSVTFSSLDEMRDFVESVFQGREAVLALAKDDRIIDQWTRVSVQNGLRGALEEFINGIIKSVNKMTDRDRRLRAKFAGLEAAEVEGALV